jgi:hypothetical protein
MNKDREVVTGTARGGLGLTGVLTVVFVVLKLIGEQFHTPVAEWSWLWVLSPLWLPTAVILGVVLLALGAAGILMLVASAIEAVIAKAKKRHRDAEGPGAVIY